MIKPNLCDPLPSEKAATTHPLLIKAIVELVKEITAASFEQNEGTKQISMAIQQLTSVTQQNSASSEEFSSNAFELNSEAKNLNESISFFKITKEEIDLYSDVEIENQIAKLSEMLAVKKAKRIQTSRNIVSEKSKHEYVEGKKASEERVQGTKINLDDPKQDDAFEAF